MWLIRIALRKPYTFVVMAMLIAIGGVLSVRKTPTDIFPTIDIPVISVLWNYGGLSPDEMEKRVTNNFERYLTTIVSDIDHIESQTLTGRSIIKIYLQPGSNVSQAIAQTTAIAQSAVRSMPPGAVPPLIMQYSATSVPIMMLALETDTLSEQQLFDYGIYFIRNELATIPGTQIPYPYGGKQRQIMVDIDPQKLHGLGLSPRDIPPAPGAPPDARDELASIPIKTVNGKTMYLRDVANVRDGAIPQTNMVHVEGKRSVLMVILKNGDASTLDVADAVKNALPRALDRLPKEARGHLSVKVMFDQSVFVRGSIEGVVREALIAAGLTGLMILLFLGSWRSTLPVITSIPLSIMFSTVLLHLMGHTLNVMTLGGLALAVGVLVDDATVAIENIHRNIGQRKPFVQAITDGAMQIAVPALVSTLCICIVFAPIALHSGAPKSQFVPLRHVVVFAMQMSYVLSRTLVPTMVHYLLAREAAQGHRPNWFSQWFDRGFERLRTGYGRWLAWTLQHRAFVTTTFLAFVTATLMLVPMLGRDFFPNVDAGMIKLHVRGNPGTRIEETEKRIANIERTIRGVIPNRQIDSMIDIIGSPYSSINMSLSEGALISSADAQILISLKAGHAPSADFMRALRTKLRTAYPETTFFFLAPDISTQVLNFGLAAPIDLEVVGPIGSEDKTLAFAEELKAKIAKVSGAADVHLAQVTKEPSLSIKVDRTMAQQSGLSERDVASDLLVSLASSGQVAPTYWLDHLGVQYLVAVQTPQYEIDSVDALRATPISTGATPQSLGYLAPNSRSTTPVNITHFNIARTFAVQANVADTDLGAVSDAVRKVVADMRKHAPPGTRITVKGQAESMDTSFGGLESGLVFAE